MDKRRSRSAILLAVAIVGVVVLAVLLLSPSPAREGRYEPDAALLQAYAVGADPRDVVIHFVLGAGDSVVGPVVSEDAVQVSVTLQAQRYVPPAGQFKNLAGTPDHVVVRLAEPLGDRRVADAKTGAFLKGPYPSAETSRPMRVIPRCAQ